MEDHDWERLGVRHTHRAAAEEVRDHLICLRGGAPFLSPRDALTLLRWLDDDIPVPTLLLALERAVASRRKNRARTPLTLTAAARHVVVVATRMPVPAPPTWHETLRAARNDATESYNALEPSQLAVLRAAAAAALGDLVDLVDENTAVALMEEEMRDQFRRARPHLLIGRAFLQEVDP